MKIRSVTINTYLCALGLLVLSGCQTDRSNEANPKKQLTAIRLHSETSPSGSGRRIEVPIYRERPVLVSIDRDAFITEANVLAASVVEQPGGFAIELKLNRQGTWLLEKYTVTNRGRRIAIFAHFGQERWIAAPLITKLINDGRLVFTPDASREEAERIVRGLNNMRRKIDSKNWIKED